MIGCAGACPRAICLQSTKRPQVYMPDQCRFIYTYLGTGVYAICNTFTRNSRGYISHVYLTTGIHRHVHQCTLKCIPGKWLHFKRSSHYHQSKDCLDVEASILLILCRPWSKLIVGLSTNMKQSYEGVSVSLLF